MQFNELQRGERFRCSIFDIDGTETIADCVKLSAKRFRRLDTGKYIKPDSTAFFVERIHDVQN